MASNPPPFQVEDNTDEDFFDKLVDDDDMDFGVTSSHGPAFLDGNESDETKDFSNLSVKELQSNCDAGLEYASDSTVNNFESLSTEIETSKQSETVGDCTNQIALSNSKALGDLIHDPKNDDEITEVSSGTTFVSDRNSEHVADSAVISTSSIVSGAPGVKEVDWSAFRSDLNKNEDNGVGAYSDFFTELGGDDPSNTWSNVGNSLDDGSVGTFGNELHGSTGLEKSEYGQYSDGNTTYIEKSNDEQYSDGNNYHMAADGPADVQDLNSSQYWENMYPGWKYEPSTGQWYQVDGYDADAIVKTNAGSKLSSTWGMPDYTAEVSYLQKTDQTVTGTVAPSGRTEIVTGWNQASQVCDTRETSTNWNQDAQVSSVVSAVPYDASQENNGYPPHMVFDPQYPEWYYDTIAQEWLPLESYMASTQSTGKVQDHMNQDGYALTNTFSQNNDLLAYGTHGQGNTYIDQALSSQGQNQNWTGSSSHYNQPGSKMWQPEAADKVEPTSQFSRNQQMENHHVQNFSPSAQGIQQTTAHHGVAGSYFQNVNQGQIYTPSSSQGFIAASQQFNDLRISQHDQKNVGNDFYGNQNSANFFQQQIPSPQISYVPAAGRSSAGRPPHALVAFGFGGKLILMKDSSSNENLNFGSQNHTKGSISVLSLAEIVNANSASNHGVEVVNYFQTLSRQAAPGPLTGGNVGAKELDKWIDERISNTKSTDMDSRKAEGLRLLLSLLKLGCQHYGKLRSPYGTDGVLKESDGPEFAVAKLFASVKRNDNQFSDYGAVAHILHQMPSDAQMLVTATEVQNLLVSGRKKEALQCAQDGQLWGPALVLAAQLGDQFYVETIKQMALRQLVAGSPLRTLCLLIAGQPADVFSVDATAINRMTDALKVPQQPPQFGSNCMLDDWEENLAVMTANRTKDDELVLIHLGDCLWKERSDIIAAHICYLVAEANFEPYSDSSRMCLIGADHWKFPRTYASPEAIQRTEIYEYSKTIGNPQFVLLPFQPYKIIYAHMLAEVGRISDSLKYCQAVQKSLKNGRSSETEILRQLVSSLDERIKTYQEGGFSTNLDPKKLVGKLLNLFDSTTHRGGAALPPPVPTVGGLVQDTMKHHQSVAPRVSTSQSTMAMSSLVPSQSMEPINEWTPEGNRKSMHSRSVSEPDFGRSPRQESNSSGEQDKATATGRSSRFGSFGFGSQLLQKTMGLVLKPRQDRQAKLGDTNKFYYDEKLKRWVEEGAAPPKEEEALPPPPTNAVFQNGTTDYNLKSTLQNEISNANSSAEYGSLSPLDYDARIPPLPPASNQYSARGRLGVRSRYVDTFNQGGGNSTNLFRSPSAPSVKQASGPNPKFFVPMPVSSTVQPVDSLENSVQETNTPSVHEHPSTSPLNDSYQPSAPPSYNNMQRFASMNSLSNNTMQEKGSFSASARRTASWSGTFSDSFSPPHMAQGKPLAEVMATHSPPFAPPDPSLAHSSMNGGSFGDDLHEVEL